MRPRAPYLQVSAVPPAGFEPATHGLGRVTKSRPVAVTRQLASPCASAPAVVTVVCRGSSPHSSPTPSTGRAGLEHGAHIGRPAMWACPDSPCPAAPSRLALVNRRERLSVHGPYHSRTEAHCRWKVRLPETNWLRRCRGREEARPTLGCLACPAARPSEDRLRRRYFWAPWRGDTGTSSSSVTISLNRLMSKKFGVSSTTAFPSGEANAASIACVSSNQSSATAS